MLMKSSFARRATFFALGIAASGVALAQDAIDLPLQGGPFGTRAGCAVLAAAATVPDGDKTAIAKDKILAGGLYCAVRSQTIEEPLAIVMEVSCTQGDGAERAMTLRLTEAGDELALEVLKGDLIRGSTLRACPVP